jgi:hypothetical protein
MSVEVYWWPPDLEGNIGHASMLVDGGSPPDPMYLSAWPMPGEYKGVVFGRALFKSYAQDVTDEGRTPHVCRLTKLNETAIKTAIKAVKGFGHYSFFSGNCAALTAFCLCQGIPTPPPIINTPWALWLYAQSLRVFYG